MFFQAGFWSCRRVRAGSLPSSHLHMSTAGRASPALHIPDSSCQADKHSKYHPICQGPSCYTSARQLCSWAGCRRLQSLEMGLFLSQMGAQAESKVLQCSSCCPSASQGHCSAGKDGRAAPQGAWILPSSFFMLEGTAESPGTFPKGRHHGRWISGALAAPTNTALLRGLRPGCTSAQQWGEMTKTPFIPVF